MTSFAVPCVARRYKSRIEQDGREILQKHFPQLLQSPGQLDVLELWELLEDEYDLQPGVAELSDGIEGMTWPDGRVQVNEETYRNATLNKGRARFTMCHEVYHGLQHRSQIQKVLVDTGELALYRRSDIDTLRDPEWQANVFAAYILMPTEMVKLVLKEACGKQIEDMMWLFGVTKTAARIRINSVTNALKAVSLRSTATIRCFVLAP